MEGPLTLKPICNVQLQSEPHDERHSTDVLCCITYALLRSVQGYNDTEIQCRSGQGISHCNWLILCSWWQIVQNVWGQDDVICGQIAGRPSGHPTVSRSHCTRLFAPPHSGSKTMTCILPMTQKLLWGRCWAKWWTWHKQGGRIYVLEIEICVSWHRYLFIQWNNGGICCSKGYFFFN